VMACLMRMLEQDIVAIDCKPEVHEEFKRRLDAEHAKLVWTTPGLVNWYRNQAGRVVSVMPWRLVDYWTFTREPDFEDYALRRRA